MGRHRRGLDPQQRPTLLIFGGTRDPEDLNAYSTLTGERDEKVETFDAHGDTTTHTMRRVPVLSPGQIAQLPFGHVVIIRRGMAPAVGKVQMLTGVQRPTPFLVLPLLCAGVVVVCIVGTWRARTRKQTAQIALIQLIAGFGGLALLMLA